MTDEIIINFPLTFDLMDYVFKNYSELDTFCKVKKTPVNTSDCVTCCSSSFYGGISQYACLNFRKVYLIRLLAAQITQTQVPIRIHLINDLRDKSKISAISLGGGPGTEAIALMNELSSWGSNCHLEFVNVDNISGWKPIYKDLVNFFAEKTTNIKLNAKFMQFDVSITGYKSDRFYDLVFISWILSHIPQLNRARVLRTARDLAKLHGHILVSERKEEAVVKDTSNLLKGISKLTLLELEKETSGHCGISFPDEIYDKFRVRVSCDSNYWLLQKTG
jgi:hypothetical protein